MSEGYTALRTGCLRPLRNENWYGRKGTLVETNSEKIVVATGQRFEDHRLSPHNDLDQKSGQSIQDRLVED